jgi:ribonuclease-3
MTARTLLQTRLGYKFRNDDLLKTALTHASTGHADYERLEFLGDRVVGLIMAERLYALYPGEPEGDLSKRHTALVRAETLARAARKLEMSDAMLLSDAERNSGGHDNENILSDIFEAIIGAVFLDGGIDAARAVLNPLMDDDMRTMSAPPRDAKTALQEWAQARNLGLPEYAQTARTGPDHAPDFTVTVKIAGYPPAEASGPSKRAAEKLAAQKLLDHVEKKS